MKKIVFKSILISVLLVSLAMLVVAPCGAQSGEKVAIYGYVTDLKSEPVVGVTVELRSGENVLLTAFAPDDINHPDAGGYIMVGVVPTGTYDLVVYGNGYREQIVDSIEVVNDFGMQQVDITVMPKSADISLVLWAVNKYSHPDGEITITQSQLLAVINAWLHPE